MTIPEQAEKLVDDLIQAARDHEKAQSYETKYTAPELEAERKKVIAALVGVKCTDREAIARALYKSRGQFDDATVKLHFDWFLEQQGLPLPLRENPEARTGIVHSYRDAAAVLALPHTGQPQEGWDYLLGKESKLHPMFGGVPTIRDLCFTAFMNSFNKNAEDGGATDWQNDTRPIVERGIEKMRSMLSAAPASPQRAEGEWRPMKTAKRDEAAILLRFAPNSGFTGCMLCWFDKDNPKGNPWRVPLCDAWFGEDLFDGWLPAPPVIAEKQTEKS